MNLLSARDWRATVLGSLVHCTVRWFTVCRLWRLSRLIRWNPGIQRIHSTTTLGAARTHSSYLSTPPDCQILTFSLECSTETVNRIYYTIVCFIFLYLVVSGLYFLAIMQHLVEWSPFIESWLLSASVWYETFIVAQLLYSLFYAFYALHCL